MRHSNNNKPIVSVRRIPAATANNMLVMIDGQPIYNPIFPGVPWSNIGISVDTIERVELIRGAGALIWSSRAANSIINIITKHSLENQKNTLTFGLGTKFERLAELQLADTFSDNGSYYINLKGQEIGRSESGEDFAFDAQSIKHVSLRADYNIDDDLAFLVTASHLDTQVESNYAIVTAPLYRSVPTKSSADNHYTDLMLRIDHSISQFSSQQLQFSYAENDSAAELFSGGYKLLNLNYAINYQLDRHQWGWGADYQYNSFQLDNKEYLNIGAQSSISSEEVGGYFQYEYLMKNDRTRLFSSLRLDRVDGTIQSQPSIKVTHQLSANSSLWSSLSRSAMSATELEKRVVMSRESEIANPFVPGAYIPGYIIGNKELKAEKQNVFEIGYRTHFDQTQLDFSAFHGRSNNAFAATVEVLATPQLNISNENSAKAKFSGAELVINQAFTPKWQVEFSASYLEQDITPSQGTFRAIPSSSMYQYSIRSDYKITDKLTSYLKLDRASKLESISQPSVDAYTTLDAGLTWQASNKLSIGLYGQNLLNASHPESPTGAPELFRATNIQRSFLLNATLAF